MGATARCVCWATTSPLTAPAWNAASSSMAASLAMTVSASFATTVEGTSLMGPVVGFATRSYPCAVDAMAVPVWPARSATPSTIVSACPAPSSSTTAPSAPTPRIARNAATAISPLQGPASPAPMAAFPAPATSPAPNVSAGFCCLRVAASSVDPSSSVAIGVLLLQSARIVPLDTTWTVRPVCLA
jgi:hypothetical protein